MDLTGTRQKASLISWAVMLFFSRKDPISHNSTLSHPDVRHGFRVDLGDDEWHLSVHQERRAIVHHDGATVDGRGSILTADTPADAEERDVDAVERLRRSEVMHGVLPLLEREALPGGPLTGEETEAGAAVGKASVGDDAEELLPDGAGGIDDACPRAVPCGRWRGWAGGE
jgi:hypothetical protein